VSKVDLSDYKRAWYLRNRERILAERARERTEEPDKVSKRKKASYQKHKGAISRARKERYATDDTLRSSTQARTRAWRAANRERHRAYSREWALKHPAAMRVRLQAWYKSNPHRVRALRLVRRGALYRAGRPQREHVALLEAHPECVYCEARFDRASSTRCRTVDHVLPLVRGGTNASDNLVPACKACNSSKNKRTVEEWVAAGLAPDGAKKFRERWTPVMRVDSVFLSAGFSSLTSERERQAQ
jgi:5-methylcytosine-specific restriction endonuclease McrA